MDEKGFMKITMAMELSYSVLRHLDREELMSVIGTLIDQWSSDHNLTTEETQRMMAELAEIQKAVHTSEGMMPKSLMV